MIYRVTTDGLDNNRFVRRGKKGEIFLCKRDSPDQEAFASVSDLVPANPSPLELEQQEVEHDLFQSEVQTLPVRLNPLHFSERWLLELVSLLSCHEDAKLTVISMGNYADLGYTKKGFHHRLVFHWVDGRYIVTCGEQYLRVRSRNK